MIRRGDESQFIALGERGPDGAETAPGRIVLRQRKTGSKCLRLGRSGILGAVAHALVDFHQVLDLRIMVAPVRPRRACRSVWNRRAAIAAQIPEQPPRSIP